MTRNTGRDSDIEVDKYVSEDFKIVADNIGNVTEKGWKIFEYMLSYPDSKVPKKHICHYFSITETELDSEIEPFQVCAFITVVASDIDKYQITDRGRLFVSSSNFALHTQTEVEDLPDKSDVFR